MQCAPTQWMRAMGHHAFSLSQNEGGTGFARCPCPLGRTESQPTKVLEDQLRCVDFGFFLDSGRGSDAISSRG